MGTKSDIDIRLCLSKPFEVGSKWNLHRVRLPQSGMIGAQLTHPQGGFFAVGLAGTDADAREVGCRRR